MEAKKYWHALMTATAASQMDVVEFFLDHDLEKTIQNPHNCLIDLNGWKDDNGHTALTLAASVSTPGCIQIILNMGGLHNMSSIRTKNVIDLAATRE